MGKNIKTKAHLHRVERIGDLTDLVGKMVCFVALGSNYGGRALYEGPKNGAHFFLAYDPTGDEGRSRMDVIELSAPITRSGTVHLTGDDKTEKVTTAYEGSKDYSKLMMRFSNAQ